MLGAPGRAELSWVWGRSGPGWPSFTPQTSFIPSYASFPLGIVREAILEVYDSVSVSSLPCNQTNTIEEMESIPAERIVPSIKITAGCSVLRARNRPMIHNVVKRNGSSNHGSKRSWVCLNHGQSQSFLRQWLILFLGQPTSGKFSSRKRPCLARWPKNWRYPLA